MYPCTMTIAGQYIARHSPVETTFEKDHTAQTCMGCVREMSIMVRYLRLGALSAFMVQLLIPVAPHWHSGWPLRNGVCAACK
jgi:hypothetical protein